MRVLLIEDDSAIAQSVELMLKGDKFNVYTTDLGEEGVDLAKLYDYDIILLDLNLPDMSGYDVIKQFRAAKITTPVLILTALDKGTISKCATGFDYMNKPFSKDELVKRIREIVARPRKTTVRKGAAPKKSNDGYVLDANGNVDTIPGNIAVALSLIADRMTNLPNGEDVRTDHPLQAETLGGIEDALNNIAGALNNVADALAANKLAADIEALM